MEMIPIAIIVVCLLISRHLGKTGSLELTEDQKEKIVIELIKVRKIFLMPIIIFFVTYALMLYNLKMESTAVNRYYLPILAVLLGSIYYVSYIKLKAIGLGEKFNRSYRMSKLVIMTGVILFMVFVFLFPPSAV